MLMGRRYRRSPGIDSPVRSCSETSRFEDAIRRNYEDDKINAWNNSNWMMILTSAGMTSPDLMRTTSPGTTFLAGIGTLSPLRITVAVGEES